MTSARQPSDPHFNAPIAQALELYEKYKVPIPMLAKRYNVSTRSILRWIKRAQKERDDNRPE